MKLAVRAKEIKGAFKGVSKYRTSQAPSGVGCTNPAVLHQFPPSLHCRTASQALSLSPMPTLCSALTRPLPSSRHADAFGR
jgi:hypothetical protein